MDRTKVGFLLGRVPEGLDPDDVEDRSELLARQSEGPGAGPAILAAARELVASQIAGDDPPATWETAQHD